MTNPGSAYEGYCVNCGRAMRAVLFFDRESVHPPAVVHAGCGCRLGDANVELERAPGEVTTAAMRDGFDKEQRLLIRGNTLGAAVSAALSILIRGREVSDHQLARFRDDLDAWTRDVRAVASEEEAR